MNGENVQNATISACLSDEETKQSTRAFLRERFLRAMEAIRGKECHFHMLENTNVKGTYLGMDIDLSYFLVSELQTPLGVVKAAKLRGQDTIWIHFPKLKSTEETPSEEETMK